MGNSGNKKNEFTITDSPDYYQGKSFGYKKVGLNNIGNTCYMNSIL